jgi:hypothetical protein
VQPAKKTGREPAWLRVARRWMPEEMNTGDLYAACGWSQGCAYWRRKTEDLKLSALIRVSQAVGAPLTNFIEDLVRELKKEPAIVPLSGTRHRHKKAALGNEALLVAMAKIKPLRWGKNPHRTKPAARR